MPGELTTDVNIKKLLNKIIKKLASGDNNDFYHSTRTTVRLNEFDFISTLQFVPPLPPKAFGCVEKSKRFLPIFRLRYIEVDASSGTIKRFKSIDDFPEKPM